ncbi:hypothetical protein MBANPS3_012051 [Mucor bainieri]
MHLTEENQKYKLATDGGNSRTFFYANSAQNWDLESYFQSTHIGLNKNKNKNIHLIDLNWVSQQDGVPNSINRYDRFLIQKRKVGSKTKASLPKWDTTDNTLANTSNDQSKQS